MKLLTKIRKSSLKFHDQGQLRPGDVDSFVKILSQHRAEEVRAVTELVKRQKVTVRRKSAAHVRQTNTVGSSTILPTEPS